VTRLELQELRRIADDLEGALDSDEDRQYAAERTLRELRELAGDAR
jgi:hypothetical protein